MDKKKFVLFAWIVAMVFPIHLFSEYSYLIPRVMGRLMDSELAHVIGHFTLFAVLILLIGAAFALPLDTRSLIMLAGAILIVAVIQEYLQLQVKGRGFGWPEMFDLGVDLAGGFVGYIVFRLLRLDVFLRKPKNA